MNYVLLFISGVCTDYFLAKWNQHFIAKRYWTAGIYSVLCGVCTVVMVNDVTQDVWSAGAWIAGLFCGTILAGQISKSK